VSTGGFSSKRLARVRELLERHVGSGFVPGVVAVLARHGEVHVEATGNLAFEGAGSGTPMAGDPICRMGSMTKPIVAACAMTLVEDCTLRLDDPVDDLLPELANMTVLADPIGPLDDTVAAKRPITLRGLLTYTLGTGVVPAEPGTVPIADALNTLGEPPPDEWIRQLGTLPLVHQPGERWMYHTAVTGEPVVEDGPDGQWRRPPAFAAGSSRPPTTTSPSPWLCSRAAPTTASGRSHGRR
jgi:CubicO group peptidase (beta-lactamase class C family)